MFTQRAKVEVLAHCQSSGVAEQLGNQCVGQPGVPAGEAIFVIRQVTEHSHNHGRSICIAKVDMTKAFDRMLFSTMWKAMRWKGVKAPIRVALMKLLLQDVVVFRGGKKNISIDRLRGSQQGGVHFLFVAVGASLSLG